MRFHLGLASVAMIIALSSTIFSSSEFLSSANAQNYRQARNAPVVSENFVVRANDPLLAQKVSTEAERFRRELAVQWLGKELPTWNQKCPITVEVARHAGGETSFAFMTYGTGRGNPIDWRMKIFGPPDRLLDAVLPHEVTHTIFATHFGRPLPRWADEGACTTVEHASERKKNHRMLMDFLSASPSRGIPFNRMFTMRNYPHDILPLYAQGYSLAKFLILQKGKRKFLDYISEGLKNESQMHELRAWDKATNDFYGFRDLSDLQIAWLEWVRNGSQESDFEKQVEMESASAMTLVRADNPATNPKFVQSNTSATFANMESKSWYAREMKKGASRVAAKPENWSPLQTKKVPTEQGLPAYKSPQESIEKDSTSNAKKPVDRTLQENSTPKKSNAPVFRDSRLPDQYRSRPKTVWR